MGTPNAKDDLENHIKAPQTASENLRFGYPQVCNSHVKRHRNRLLNPNRVRFGVGFLNPIHVTDWNHHLFFTQALLEPRVDSGPWLPA